MRSSHRHAGTRLKPFLYLRIDLTQARIRRFLGEKEIEGENVLRSETKVGPSPKSTAVATAMATVKDRTADPGCRSKASGTSLWGRKAISRRAPQAANTRPPAICWASRTAFQCGSGSGFSLSATCTGKVLSKRACARAGGTKACRRARTRNQLVCGDVSHSLFPQLVTGTQTSMAASASIPLKPRCATPITVYGSSTYVIVLPKTEASEFLRAPRLPLTGAESGTPYFLVQPAPPWQGLVFGPDLAGQAHIRARCVPLRIALPKAWVDSSGAITSPAFLRSRQKRVHRQGRL